MKIRWIRRYKVSHTSSNTVGGKAHFYLDSDLVLQEMVKTIQFPSGKSNETWADVEIFEDLESKETAIEELQKQGVFVQLKMR